MLTVNALSTQKLEILTKLEEDNENKYNSVRIESKAQGGGAIGEGEEGSVEVGL